MIFRERYSILLSLRKQCQQNSPRASLTLGSANPVWPEVSRTKYQPACHIETLCHLLFSPRIPRSVFSFVSVVAQLSGNTLAFVLVLGSTRQFMSHHRPCCSFCINVQHRADGTLGAGGGPPRGPWARLCVAVDVGWGSVACGMSLSEFPFTSLPAIGPRGG